ncbi:MULTISPECIES: DUF4181 domain-containing protein [Paenibacillus]|uniref:DUF4181 domain-containing protein n=1 Tax=Paenibacillus TaxID=44249 RepID=UPI001E5817E9|nr:MULTISPECIES: DUF4181 domain-containing protein [Paenibacillus]MEE4570075.1 DUF4181 domain-containing protein [Paenibacillus polymyxa]WPQ58889.1 DUF4181 domain-containing protein [Paenibacillus polymyxa]
MNKWKKKVIQVSFYLVLFIAAVIQFVLDKIISKTDEKISDTDGFIPYRWFVVIGGIGIFLSLFFVNEPPYKYVWIGVLLIIVFGVRSIFQWKYIRSSQKHITSLLMMAISVVGTIVYVLI